MVEVESRTKILPAANIWPLKLNIPPTGKYTMLTTTLTNYLLEFQDIRKLNSGQ